MAKHIPFCRLCIILCIFVTILLAACSEKTDSTMPTENIVKKYYSMEDFGSIVIGESTLSDVAAVASIEDVCAQSYGAFCELPMKDGRYILIKFRGSEMIVGSIEVIEEPILGGT